MRRLCHESILPVLELDISDSDVPRAADRVADWGTLLQVSKVVDAWLDVPWCSSHRSYFSNIGKPTFSS